MSITKVKARGKDRYRVRYREPGNRSPLSKTFDRKAEAEAFEDAVRNAKRGGLQVRKATNQTLASFGVEYVQKYASVELAAATRATNRVLWNRYVLPRLGSHQMVVLAHQPEIVQEFKAELVADGVGDPTIKRTLTVLSAVLGKAVEWNRIPSNPVATVRKPSGKRSKPVCTLAPEVVERLRVAMPSGRDRRLVSVLAYSGLRPGEALALESTDVGKKTISVARAIKLDGPGDTKTHKARSISLLGVLAADLEDIGVGLIFPGHDGEHWTRTAYGNWRERVWQPACETVGIGTITTTKIDGKPKRSYTGATPYDLRHSFASLMFHEQRNPLEIADMLGHSPQVLFSTYAHVIAELRGAAPISAEDQIKAARSRIHDEDA
jgi:integrase